MIERIQRAAYALLLLLFFAAPVQAQGVTVDGTSSANTSGSVNSINWSHTVGSGSSRLLIVGMVIKSGSNITPSISFNGVALTRLAGDYNNPVNMEFWYLVNPPVGTYTVSASYNKNWSAVGAISFFNVNQASPFGTVVTSTGDSTSASYSVSSAAGELVVDMIGATDAPTLTSGAGQTKRIDQAASTQIRIASSTHPGAATVPMEWTLGSQKRWSAAGVSIRQALPNDAQFVSQSVPACMLVGQTYSASVTMRNVGTNTWTSAGNYRLGSQNPSNNTNWGFNTVNLPASVAPGQEVTFTFDVTPVRAGIVNFRWRMLQSGVEWFGQLSANVATSVGSRSLLPTADALVRGGAYANNNYGTETNLHVKEDNNNDFRRQSFLKFDTNAVSGTVDRADLCLNANVGSPPSLNYSVHSVANISWSETGITWNNKPALGSVLDTVAIDDQSLWAWYTWNVSSYLQAERAAGRNTISLGVWRTTVDSSLLSIRSRESTGSSKPTMMITLLNDAQFMSQSVPSTMIAGQTYSVSVTFKNTGTSTWTSANSYRLGSQNPHDNATWGFNRVTLPASVAPGAQGTLTFEVTAPSSAGTYNFQWRMVQETVEWFGDVTTNVPVTVTIGAGGFNAYETSTAAGAVSGVIQTKVAGSTITVALIALNSAKTAILTSFTGQVKVELLDASNNSAAPDSDNCRSSWNVIQTLPTVTFAGGDNGRKQISFTQANAYRDARIRVSFPATGTPTAIGCSTDNFAIRPATLSIVATDANRTTAGTTRTLDVTDLNGAIVHNAGRPFRIAATAYNAAGTPAVTSNYGGTPVAVLSACGGTACTATQAPLTLGTWTASGGTVTTTTASYPDVGAFELKLEDSSFAAVDAGDGTPLAQRTIASAPTAVGRFVPDRFWISGMAITPRTDIAACSGSTFTYMGERMDVTFTLTAVAYPNGVTARYAGSLARLALNTPSSFSFGARDGIAAANLSARVDTSLGSSGVWNSGVGTVTAVLSLQRAAAPDGPYGDVQIGIAPVDADGVILNLYDMDADGNGVNERRMVGTTAVRFGRLRLQNAVGSQLVSLLIPVEAQYWNGSAFITNTADNCTSVGAANVALGNFQKGLAAGHTALSVGGAFDSGRGSLRLSAPGAANGGSVDVSINLGSAGAGASCTAGMPASTQANRAYLQGAWCGAAHDRDPTARATFGLHRSAERVIYRRENF